MLLNRCIGSIRPLVLGLLLLLCSVRQLYPANDQQRHAHQGQKHRPNVDQPRGTHRKLKPLARPVERRVVQADGIAHLRDAVGSQTQYSQHRDGNERQENNRSDGLPRAHEEHSGASRDVDGYADCEHENDMRPRRPEEVPVPSTQIDQPRHVEYSVPPQLNIVCRDNKLSFHRLIGPPGAVDQHVNVQRREEGKGDLGHERRDTKELRLVVHHYGALHDDAGRGALLDHNHGRGGLLPRRVSLRLRGHDLEQERWMMNQPSLGCFLVATSLRCVDELIYLLMRKV
mmetsp:Transcript_16450/g.40694  ORF Transcript_16450/g.40694 Transcript_16450/m.40694 type:complete len:286 (+) Transcript_16450:1024-1881(+)